MSEYCGNIVDVISKRVYPGRVFVENGIIVNIEILEEEQEVYILPGFVDSHVHIESSMVTPMEFSREAVKHGTVGSVSDPHEIANVLGIEGVEFMLKNAAYTPMKILFGAPSCVPATPFESSGAVLNAEDVDYLLQKDGVGYLSEMMNYPGVVNSEPEVLKKIDIAKKHGSVIDGHAPGLSGDDLSIYAGHGITTDHECFTLEEAREKIHHGMKIQIREGSGAKNFEALIPLLNESPGSVLFCSDDLHPDDLLKGHINLLVKRALEKGYDLFDVLRAANYNAINHYKLNIGLLKKEDPADFIIVDSLQEWNLLKTVIDGVEVFDGKNVHIPKHSDKIINRFDAEKIKVSELFIPKQEGKIKVIQAINGELITKKVYSEPFVSDGGLISNTDKDVLKIIVLNRYTKKQFALGFIKGFGIRVGAMASSIAHDSHNVICVGTSDQMIAETVNWIIEQKGGIALHDGKSVEGLPLSIAGIMTEKSVAYAAGKYKNLSEKAAKSGTLLDAPFMTLAFMSLLVIPELKLSDKGLFDGNTFSFTSLFS